MIDLSSGAAAATSYKPLQKFEALDPRQWPASRPALITDDGLTISYAELADRVDAFGSRLGVGRALVMLEASNSVESIVAYLAALKHGHAVMMLPKDQPDFAASVRELYGPQWSYRREPNAWTLARESNRRVDLHPDLAVMLSTSGSTGAVKFVRLSRQNVTANALAIAGYLKIGPDDRALMTLPFHYSYGLSVVNSHLAVGAALLVTGRSVTDPVTWQLAAQHGATSVAGVPYTYELLDQIGFQSMDLPRLRTLTQAGGRLTADTVRRYAQWARGRGVQFYVMYGQTEATARMAYLPPEQALESPDAVGQAIPGGRFRLVADDGSDIVEVDREGQLAYSGPNVMMGYATSAADLARGPELSELMTGDLARRLPNGLFKVSGRKSRFIKPYGLRIGLDEVESFLAAQGFRVACGGNDEALVVLTLDAGQGRAVSELIARKLGLPPAAIQVHQVDGFPLLPSGKIDYAGISAMARSRTATSAWALDAASAVPATNAQSASSSHDDADRPSPAAIYQTLFPGRPVTPNDSFVSLGGDSLTYVEASMSLTDSLGRLPPGWQDMTVEALDKLAPRGTPRAPSRFRPVDMPAALRFCAIVMVVAGHFALPSVAGGAYLLLAVAGYNFAAFQVARSVDTGSVLHIFRSIARVAVPSTLYLTLLQVATNRYSVPELLLVSNWTEVNEALLGVWFIELLLQVLVIAAVLLAIPGLRRTCAKAPFAFSVGLVAASYVLTHLVPMIWSTDHLYNRVPHMLLWMFALGWCVFCARTTAQKTVAFAIVLSTCGLWFEWVPGVGWASNAYVMAFGLLLLLHVPNVSLPAWVQKAVHTVAGASLFIYLSHFQARNVFTRLTGLEQPLLQLVAALAVGVILWTGWERLLRDGPRLIQRGTARLRGA